MAIEVTERRDRRAFLAAGLGGLAAAAVATLAQAAPTLAEDENVQVGHTYTTATLVTQLQNITNNNDVLFGRSDGSGAGVTGYSGSGYGVSAGSASGYGVHAVCFTGTGVYGLSEAGPLGHGADAAGTLGDNNADGVGVWGRSAHGVGVFADAAHADAVAFKAKGVTQFSRSGKLTVPAHASSAIHNGIAMSASSLVLATIQGAGAAGVYVLAVTPDAAHSKFTVKLSKAVATATTVAWFVVN